MWAVAAPHPMSRPTEAQIPDGFERLECQTEMIVTLDSPTVKRRAPQSVVAWIYLAVLGVFALRPPKRAVFDPRIHIAAVLDEALALRPLSRAATSGVFAVSAIACAER